MDVDASRSKRWRFAGGAEYENVGRRRIAEVLKLVLPTGLVRACPRMGWFSGFFDRVSVGGGPWGRVSYMFLNNTPENIS